MLNISILQIILVLISLMFLLSGFMKFIKGNKNQTFFKFIFTLIIWGGIFLFSLFPNLTHILTKRLGFGENLNTLIFIGFVIAFIAIFKIVNILERIERSISEIVRKEALSKIKETE